MNKHASWWTLAAIALVAFAGVCIAQRVTVDQGFPGSTGPWKVSFAQCFNPAHNTLRITANTPVNCPSSQLANRRFITFCNSPENSGSPLIKIRIDGTNPTMGTTNVGDALGAGSCVTYQIDTTIQPKCNTDTTNTAVTMLECQ